jgi:hypothetical protein
MIEPTDKQEKKSASAAPRGEQALADGELKASSRPGTSPGTFLGTSLGTSLAVFWMWLVLAGFVVIRIVGSQSFRALHWFGKAR